MPQIKPRTDISSEKLRIHLKKIKNARVYRRLLGIIHLLEGGSRNEAQAKADLTVNNFRHWIRRFNEHGVDGLQSAKPTGRPLKINREAREALRAKVLAGPSADDGLVRFRLIDLQDYLKKEYGVSIALSGVWEALAEMKLSWKTGRQRNPKSDEVVQEEFKKNLP